MAADRRLLEEQKRSDALPVLRFYQWVRPSVSIGYFQDLDKIRAQFGDCYEIVKRPTGGGLVFHGEDLTFSIVAKESHPLFRGGLKDSYLKVNEILWRALKEIFPGLDFFDCKNLPSGRATLERVCFDQPACYDLMLDGKKVVGASQRRSGGAALYQSSIFLNADREILVSKIVAEF